MNMKKHFLLFLMFLPVLAHANLYGECGDGVIYRLEGEVLTISITGSGSGDMYNYTPLQSGADLIPPNPSPWWNERFQIKKIVIESGVISIGEWAFYNCTGVRELEMSEGVIIIKEGAFYGGCYYIEHLTLPNSVSEICEYAFSSNRQLKKVTLGNGIKQIRPYAFYGCPINIVECYSPDAPNSSPVSFSEALYFVLYVPAEYIVSYMETSPWKDYCFIKPMNDTNANSSIKSWNNVRDNREFYNLCGVKSKSTVKGLNIIKTKNRVIKMYNFK